MIHYYYYYYYYYYNVWGKAVLSIHIREVSCLAIPAVVGKSVSLQTQAQLRARAKSFGGIIYS